jgi:hypothetical protein
MYVLGRHTGLLVHRGVRHRAEGCMTLRWWQQCRKRSLRGTGQHPVICMPYTLMGLCWWWLFDSWLLWDYYGPQEINRKKVVKAIKSSSSIDNPICSKNWGEERRYRWHTATGTCDNTKLIQLHMSYVSVKQDLVSLVSILWRQATMIRFRCARYCTSQKARDYWRNGNIADSTTNQEMVAVQGSLYAPTPFNINLYVVLNSFRKLDPFWSFNKR